MEIVIKFCSSRNLFWGWCPPHLCTDRRLLRAFILLIWALTPARRQDMSLHRRVAWPPAWTFCGISQLGTNCRYGVRSPSSGSNVVKIKRVEHGKRQSRWIERQRRTDWEEEQIVYGKTGRTLRIVVPGKALDNCVQRNSSPLPTPPPFA